MVNCDTRLAGRGPRANLDFGIVGPGDKGPRAAAVPTSCSGAEEVALRHVRSTIIIRSVGR